MKLLQITNVHLNTYLWSDHFEAWKIEQFWNSAKNCLLNSKNASWNFRLIRLLRLRLYIHHGWSMSKKHVLFKNEIPAFWTNPTRIQVQKLWLLRIDIDSFDLILVAHFSKSNYYDCILSIWKSFKGIFGMHHFDKKRIILYYIW